MPFDPKLVRRTNLRTLHNAGFTVAPSLPLSDPAPTLRPIPEIARRLAALNTLFIYATAPESRFPTSTLHTHIKQNHLDQSLTPEEAAILRLDRESAIQQHGDSIGWKTENAIALAWILGLADAPDHTGQMLQGPQVVQLVTTPDPAQPAAFQSWLATLTPRDIDQVAAMQDLFYCAHNAARSAQVQMMEARGRAVRFDTVPPDFDPVGNAGVIHERRHALTWALSPGVEWDETDLDT